MIVVGPDVEFEATADGFATGLTGTLGVAILDTPDDNVVVPRTTAGIVEAPPGSGLYGVTLTSPPDAGMYSVVWDDGATYAREELEVSYTAPQTEGDLCTLEEVREHAQYQVTSTDDDDVIRHLITAMSAHINGVREFAPAVAGVRSMTRLPGSGIYVFAPWTCRGATAVTVDGVTVAAGRWRLANYDAVNEVYLGLELADVPAPTTFTTSTITIDGEWGHDAIPADVREACILAVLMHLRGDVQAFGSAFQPNSLGDDVNAAEALPPGIRGLLCRYEEPLVA